MRLLKAVLTSLLLYFILTLNVTGLAAVPDTPTPRPLFERDPYSIRSFAQNEGLSSPSTFALTLDKQGYLWAATSVGAAYYNGYHWVSVKLPDKNNLIAYSLLAASDGSIWLGTDQGLFQLKDKQWKTYDVSNGFLKGTVYALIEVVTNGESTLWAGTTNGLARLKKNNWEKYFKTDGLPSNEIHTLLWSERTKRLWIGSSKGLAVWQNEQIKPYTEQKLPGGVVYSLAETGRQQNYQLWVGTEEGLAAIGETQVTIYGNDVLPNKTVRALYRMSLSNGQEWLWVGTLAGATCWQGNRWVYYGQDLGLLINGFLSTPTQTGTNVLWVASAQSLVRLEENIWYNYGKNDGFPAASLLALLETKNDAGDYTIWVGTQGQGLGEYRAGHWRYHNVQTGLPSNAVTSLLATKTRDNQTVLWIGTVAGLVRWENNKQTVITTKDGLSTDIILSLMVEPKESGKETLWIGTLGGGVCYLEDNVWKSLTTKDGLPDNRVLALLKTGTTPADSIVWIGTASGLAWFQHGKVNTYDMTNGLPDNLVTCLLEYQQQDGQKVLLVGTKTGIVWIDPQNPKSGLHPYAVKGEFILQMRNDQTHRLYISDKETVMRWDLPNAKAEPTRIQRFSAKDGIPLGVFGQGASLVDHAGRIWFGGALGVGIFDPRREINNDITYPLSPLVLDKISLNEQSTTVNTNQVLAYNENNFILEYAFLNYFREEDVQYQRQLEGFDRQVSAWTKDRKAVYTNLREGKYTFKVWAKDHTNRIVGPTLLSFEIRPAPWRTWWAYSIYVLVVAGLVYGGVRLRLQTLEIRNRELEGKVQARTVELAEKIDLLDRKNVELDRKNNELAKKNHELDQAYRQAKKIFSALSEALPGTVLEERYKLEDKIGAGGFGAVYRAMDLRLQRPVAIKVFRPSNNADADDTFENLERFRLEAVSTCRVNHPNAVSMIDFGISTNGIAYIVMELLEGETLTSEIARHGSLPPERCAAILTPVCSVLAEAHHQGIIHRDIKPDNIFLHHTKEGEVVKVLDFGIAKLLGKQEDGLEKNLTADGGLIGTPVYMAPERFSNKSYDGRADVYSLGIVLYQMLSGSVPFKPSDGSVWSLIAAHVSETPPPLRRGNLADLDPAIEEVVMQALSKDPELRPNIHQFLERLGEVMGFCLRPDNNTQNNTRNSRRTAMLSFEDVATQRVKVPDARVTKGGLIANRTTNPQPVVNLANTQKAKLNTANKGDQRDQGWKVKVSNLDIEEQTRKISQDTVSRTPHPDFMGEITPLPEAADSLTIKTVGHNAEKPEKGNYPNLSNDGATDASEALTVMVYAPTAAKRNNETADSSQVNSGKSLANLLENEATVRKIPDKPTK
jgi:serine/threonine protein kinase/ligand-binding sensor domain-containing protein